MNISEAVFDEPVENGQVFTTDAYRPARTLATQETLWAVQDAALQNTGAYSLIEHGIAMGLFGFGSQFMGYSALSGLMQDGLIAACVNTLASDMTREFIKLFMSGDDNEAEGDTIVADMEEDLVKHQIRKKFNTAASWTQQFGGCMLFIDTGAQGIDLLKPLSPYEIKRGFKGFKLIEPINTSPGSYNSSNPLADDFFVPRTWWVWAQEVHKSRLIQFVGEELNTLLKPSYNFYGIPHVQRIYDAVLHFKENRQSVNRMLKKYSSTVFKTNMQEIITGGVSPRVLDKRVRLFARNQSNDGVFAIDFESEDVVKVESNLAGLKDILQQSLELVASLDGKPAVKLLGLSPSGFSTGDTDLDNYYDNVQSRQENWFREPLQRVLEVLQIVRYGETYDNLMFSFVELSEEDELQASQIRKTDADMGAVLITNGVISPEEERERLKMTEGSGYDNLTMTDIDTDIEADPESQSIINTILGFFGRTKDTVNENPKPSS